MRILDVLKLTRQLYEAGDTVLLEGPPGGGKTSIVREEMHNILAAIYPEFGSHETTPPTLDAPDYRGYMFPSKDKDGEPVSLWTRPSEVPSKDYLAEHQRGILLVDELSSAEHLTSKALASLLLERKLGNVQLPKGWWVVATGNRSQDRAGALRILSHIQNRIRVIPIENDALSWSVWAEARGIHPLIISWVKQNPNVAFVDEVPSTGKPFSTPRSVARAANVLQVGMRRDADGKLIDMELPSDHLVQQAVYGDIGEGAGAHLFGYLKVWDKLPTLEEIMADPEKAKCPSELSAGWAAGQMCIHYANKDNIDKLWRYTERLPREVQVSMAKSLLERSGSALLNSQALIKWIHANKALITSSTGR